MEAVTSLHGSTAGVSQESSPVENEHSGRRSGSAIIARGKWEAPIPLSYAQERLWRLNQFGLSGASAYNMSFSVRSSGAIDEVALDRSLSEIVRRHESLRTHFLVRDGVPHQMVG